MILGDGDGDGDGDGFINSISVHKSCVHVPNAQLSAMGHLHQEDNRFRFLGKVCHSSPHRYLQEDKLVSRNGDGIMVVMVMEMAIVMEMAMVMEMEMEMAMVMEIGDGDGDGDDNGDGDGDGDGDQYLKFAW